MVGLPVASPMPSRLRQTGALVLGGAPASPVGRDGRGGRSGASTPAIAQYESPSAPPSVRQTGRLWNSRSCPSLEPYAAPAENLPGIKAAKLRKCLRGSDGLAPCVWSDSMRHLTQDSWPTHAVPLFVYCGQDRPRLHYREEAQLTVKEERYVNFCLRLRCGGGDRYMGGSIGLVYTPDRREAEIGQEGQLVTILDIVVNPDSTASLTVVGDQPFVVQRTWMPRSLRDLQYAIVEVQPVVDVKDESVLSTMLSDESVCRFARLLQLAAPTVAAELHESRSAFTVFAPSNAALEAAFGARSDEDIASCVDLESLLLCHIVRGRFPSEAMHAGRALAAVDGSSLLLGFGKWPRGDPRVNDVPVVCMDASCSNGVVHTLAGVLTPPRGGAQLRGRGR